MGIGSAAKLAIDKTRQGLAWTANRTPVTSVLNAKLPTLKGSLMGTTLIAGAVALGGYMMMNRTGEKYNEDERPVARVPEIYTPAHLALTASPMGNAPSMNDGSMDFPDMPHLARVRPELAAQQLARNPNQSVQDADKVAELGGAQLG